MSIQVGFCRNCGGTAALGRPASPHCRAALGWTAEGGCPSVSVWARLSRRRPAHPSASLRLPPSTVQGIAESRTLQQSESANNLQFLTRKQGSSRKHFSRQERIIPAGVFNLHRVSQFGIVFYQRLRRPHFLPVQQMPQLQRIHRGLRLEVVVRNYVGRFGPVSNDFYFFFPLLQFGGLVKVVVTIIPIAVIAVEPALKPMLVVAAMQADISDARRDMLGGSERATEQRLIDVAETDVMAHE